GLTKRYDGANVVDRLDLAVDRGELYGFLGPNGAGKTTTIRMALGLIFPSGGEVELLDCPMSAGRERALRRTGAMIEEPAVYLFLSGPRNLEGFARAGGDRGGARFVGGLWGRRDLGVVARAGGDGEEVRRRLSRIEEALEQVGLSTAGDKRGKGKIPGMRRRR